jgi:hypothetical protein
MILTILDLLKMFMRVLGILGLSVAIIAFIGLQINWRFFYFFEEFEFDIDNSNNNGTPQVTIVPTKIVIESNVNPITKEIEFIDFEDISTNELDFLSITLNKAAANWDGNFESRIPIIVSDFSRSQLDSFLAQYNEPITQQFSSELIEYYSTQTAINEIRAVAKDAVGEFINYIEAKQIYEPYFLELKNNTLPFDIERISIDSTSNIVPGRIMSNISYIFGDNMRVVNNDFSKLAIRLYVSDIYQLAQKLKANNVLGEFEDEKTYRDFAIRYYMYNFSTRALQKSVETVLTPTRFQKDQDTYLKASWTTNVVNQDFEFNWGERARSIINNREMIYRIQSHNIATEMLENVYEMSESQLFNFRSFMFERFQASYERLERIIRSFNSQFPDIEIQSIKNKIVSDFINPINPRNEYKQSLVFVSNNYDILPEILARYKKYNQKHFEDFWLQLQQARQ